MAATGQKWAIGCGIGCLLLIVILGGVGTCGYIGFKQLTDRAEELEVHLDELDDRFGPLETYVPPADGALDAATVQIFLAAREDMLVRGAPMVEVVDTLEGEGGPLAKIRAGMKLIPGMLEFVGQRAAVLLEHDLHPGEYSYIYAVAYYSWLGHDPGDGPDFRIDGDDEDRGFRWQTDAHDGDIRTDRARGARRTLNDLMIAWLRHQQEALAATGDADSEWAAVLAAEIEALRSDPERLAWEAGLPAALEASLSPYRGSLENAYSELLNGMEVSLLRDEH